MSKESKAAYQKAWRQKQSPEWQEANKQYLRRWHKENREASNLARKVRYLSNPQEHQRVVKACLEKIKSRPEALARIREMSKHNRKVRNHRHSQAVKACAVTPDLHQDTSQGSRGEKVMERKYIAVIGDKRQFMLWMSRFVAGGPSLVVKFNEQNEELMLGEFSYIRVDNTEKIKTTMLIGLIYLYESPSTYSQAEVRDFAVSRLGL